MRNPCKNCEDRYHNCHSQCDEYKAFASERDRINNARRQAFSLDYDTEVCKKKFKNYFNKMKKGARYK